MCNFNGNRAKCRVVVGAVIVTVLCAEGRGVSNQGWADPTHTNTDTYDRNATYTEHLNMIIRLHITVIATIAL